MKIRDNKGKKRAKESAEVFKAAEDAGIIVPPVTKLLPKPDESRPTNEGVSVPPTTSDDLLAAANDPGAALRDEEREAINELIDAGVIDAAFAEVPEGSEAELAAQILEQEAIADELGIAAAGEARHPAADMFDTPPPIEQKISEWSLAHIRDGGEELVQWMGKIWKGTKRNVRKVGLRIERARRDVWDHIKVLGNKGWAAYDKWQTDLETKPWYVFLKVKATAVYDWAVKTNAEATKVWNDLRAKTKAEKAVDGVKELTNVLTAMLHKIDVMNKTIEAQNTRILQLEKQVGKNTAATAKVSSLIVHPDTEKLALFTQAMAKGKKTNAAKIWRDMTGVSVTEATLLVNSLAPA